MSLAKAEADLVRLTNQIAELQKQIVIAESHAQKIRTYLEMARIYETGDAPAADSNSASRGGRPAAVGISHDSVRLAIEAITRAQAPLHTRALIEILREGGVEVGGQNPLANLSGFLSRSEKLKNSRQHGWSLAEWPSDYPPGSTGEIKQSGEIGFTSPVVLDAGTF